MLIIYDSKYVKYGFPLYVLASLAYLYFCTIMNIDIYLVKVWFYTYTILHVLGCIFMIIGYSTYKGIFFVLTDLLLVLSFIENYLGVYILSVYYSKLDKNDYPIFISSIVYNHIIVGILTIIKWRHDVKIFYFNYESI